MSSTPGSDSSGRAGAEELFVAFLSTYSEGDDVAFARLCTSHPEQAVALRRLRQTWRQVGSAVDDLGHDFADDAERQPRGAPTDRHRPGAHSEHVEPTLDLDLSAPSRGALGVDEPGSVEAALRRLSAGPTPYAPEREIGRGAMGRILRVWDGRLRRTLAMKVLLDRNDEPADGQRDAAAQRRLSRFLDEAQITGQLDHPGVVPVHELGLDADGRLYFTMRLVRGRSFRSILDLARDGADGWTVPRALGVVQKVCEAMAYAHSKGVIHRDIKPSNVMVGRFGETYVMDWGLAKVLGRADPGAPPTAVPRAETTADDSDPSISASEIRTDRLEHGERSPDSPLLTLEGTVVGTPAYMAPEQALGSLDVVGPPADVYAVGSMLYHLLAGQMPYVHGDERATPSLVLERVRAGPPRPLHSISRRLNPELVAICERAMARDPAARYADMTAMAEDLRAFLEGRVVRSYQVGAAAELRKWVVRNRAFATVIAVAIAALAALTLWLYDVSEQRREQTVVIGQQLETSRTLEQQALSAQHEAERAAGEAEQAREAAERSALSARRNAYAASIAAAESALEHGDISEARRLLAGCAAGQRGWEWEHLALRVDPSLAVLRAHTGAVTAVAFAPDDTLVASASWDGTVRLWDSDSGLQLLTIEPGDASLSAMVIHPDGSHLACAGGDDRISLWGLPGGEAQGIYRVGSPLDDRPRAVATCMAYAPDGQRLYVGTDQRRLVAIDTTSGRRVEFPRLHGGAITSVSVSPDGGLVVTGSEDRTAGVWDTRRTDLVTNLFGHEGAVRATAVSPLGNLVATGADDGSVRLFSLADGRLRLSVAAHDEPVTGLAFAPDGALLVSCSEDRTARLWDPYGGRLLATLTGHAAALTAVTFDHSGNRLASASTDGTARLWDSAYQGALTWLHGHADRVESLAVSSRDDLLVSAGWDGRAQLWDTDTRTPMAARDLSARAAVVAFSPDGTRAATADTTPGSDRSHIVSLWDERQLSALASEPRRLVGHTDAVRAVAFSPDGTLLATGGNDQRVLLWDTDSGETLRTLPHDGWVHALAFQPDGGLLASASHDGALTLWDLDDGGARARWQADDAIFTLAYSPRGDVLAMGGADGLLRLVDGHSLELLRALPGHQDDVLALAFHPDQPRLASASRDGTLRLWETGSGLRLLSLRSRVAPQALAFAADGARLFAAVGASIAIHETRGPASTWELRERQRHVQSLAETLVREQLDTLVDPRTVIAALSARDDLDPALRDEALRLTRNFGDDPALLAEAAWSVLVDPHAGPHEYQHARRQARAAERLADGERRLAHLVGLAHFRCGDDRAALGVLEKAHQANRRAPTYPVSWDLFFIAMANKRLGYQTQAQVYLAQALIEAELDSTDQRETTLAFGSEARQLIEDGAAR